MVTATSWIASCLLPLLISAANVSEKTCSSDPKQWRNDTFTADCVSLDKLSAKQAASAADCCARCSENDKCNQWVYQPVGSQKPGQNWVCKLCKSQGSVQRQPGAVSGPGAPLPPTPPPTPQPKPRANAPNIIFILTDDQDRVAEDGYVSLSAAMWKYMTTSLPSPSSHSIMTGFFEPNASDEQA